MKKYTINRNIKSNQVAVINRVYGESMPEDNEEFKIFPVERMIGITKHVVNDPKIFLEIPEVQYSFIPEESGLIIVVLKPGYTWDNMPNQGIGIFETVSEEHFICEI